MNTLWHRRLILLAGVFLLVPRLLGQSTPLHTVPAGNFRIAGTVVSATTGHPLARAQVTLSNARNRQETQLAIASDEGRFEFRVNAGKYGLQASKRGFIAAAYDQHEQFSTAIVTGAGLDTENLFFRLAPDAVIAGKVLDEAGEPVREASVTLYREDRQSGVGRIRAFNQDATDDQGGFEFAPLDGGIYFVAVSGKPWYAVHPITAQPGVPAPVVDESLDVAYPTTYYGDSTEADDATPIPLRGGDHAEIEIHLTPTPALHLFFHTSENERAFAVPFLQKPAFDGVDNVPNDGLQRVAPGVYEMTGVPAGRYSVHPAGRGGDQASAGEVDLTSNGQELAPISNEATTSIKATVQLLAGGPVPAQMQVALRSPGRRIAAVGAVNDKGEVEFHDVTPGTYQVIAGSPTTAYAVSRIVGSEHETSGHTLVVPQGASLSITLVLVAGKVTVEGVAQRNSKPASGAMIVLVPKDPESGRELFRRDQSDQDGSFTLRGVVPGSYTILAIEDGWDLDWAKPAVIAHYAAKGKTILVKDQASGTLKVPEPVAVQTK